MGREETWDTAGNRRAMAGNPAGQPAPPVETPEDGEEAEPAFDEAEWKKRHRAAYQASTDWQEANLRTQWERNYRTFNNKHPTGSKYYSDDYKHRSKLFRPKTRSSIRKSEAAVAKAFFSTADLLSVSPGNPDDEMQEASAKVHKELLNYRLGRRPIRWFPTVLGAWQDTRTVGVCVSKQWWEFEQRAFITYAPMLDSLTGQPLLDDEGNPLVQEMEATEVVKDEPHCDLVAPENIRIDPGADWIDPINSSPYVIELTPMYVGDLKARMGKEPSKTGEQPWKVLEDAQIRSARAADYNSTRQAREDYRKDSKDSHGDLADHEIVWVHETFIRVDGEDWHYFMLGTEHFLTEPQPAASFYLHGVRPYVMGYSTIEAHKAFPASITELAQDLQQEANENVNQRIDNVRIAMNSRPFVKAGKGVDMKSLMMWAPGMPITMKNPGGTDPDVVFDRPPDVTASAYLEQDRINVDYDEMAGSFSTSSVQSNRQMNETVGGMQLLKGGSDQIIEFDLRVFAETWAEPVMQQLIQLEQAYETDQNVLAIAGKRAKLLQRYGMDEVTDELLQGQVTATVNVGLGVTDSEARFQRASTGFEALARLYGPDAPRRLNRDEMAKEIMGILGYRDGERFLISTDEDPKIEQLQSIIEKMSEELQRNTQDAQVKLALEKMRSKSALSKQSMADQTDILIEMLRLVAAKQLQAGEQVAAESAAVRSGFEGERDRQFQGQQAERDRAHQSVEGERQRQFQGSQSEADRQLAAKQRERRVAA